MERIKANNERVKGELLENAVREASWMGGKGPDGLQKAQRIWQDEMDNRRKIPGARHPWAIEGHLDGKVVYRERSIGGNVPADMKAIPEGREQDVNYEVVAYIISA